MGEGKANLIFWPISGAAVWWSGATVWSDALENVRVLRGEYSGCNYPYVAKGGIYIKGSGKIFDQSVLRVCCASKQSCMSEVVSSECLGPAKAAAETARNDGRNMRVKLGPSHLPR